MNEVKPGVTTSEFKLTVVASTILGVLTIYGIVNEEQAEAWRALLISVLPICAYIISRAIAKKQ